MMRTFATIAFVAAALSITQSSYPQTTTDGENPCACWIDVKTGKPVPTVPLSGVNVVGNPSEDLAKGVDPGITRMEGFDPNADHAYNSKTGQTFYRGRDGCWIDVKTGKPVPTVPLSGVNVAGNPSEDLAKGVDPGITRMERFDPNADHAYDSKTGRTFVRVPCPPPTATTTPPATPGTTGTVPPTAPPQENKRVALQFRGFGGATIVNSNTPSTAGFDGAVLFPLGNRVLVGPTAGFQWVDSSIVKTIGGGPPPSTFINTSVGFKSGNFGGRIGYSPFGGWQIGVQGGATVGGSTITQNQGFCGTSSSSSAVTCTVLSSSTTNDTVVGPFVGAYVSRTIFSRVGVFVEYDYRRLKDTQPNPTNPSGPSITVFDLHYSDVVAGLVLSFGRRQAK